jgi:hypothetical protein
MLVHGAADGVAVPLDGAAALPALGRAVIAPMYARPLPLVVCTGAPGIRAAGVVAPIGVKPPAA